MSNKQLTYPGLITRMFASILDLFVLFLILSPIIYILNSALFYIQFREYMILHGVNLNETNAYQQLLRNSEFQQYLVQNSSSFFMGQVLPIMLTQIVLSCAYFVFLWHKKGWTIGKLILGLRVVDEETLQPPSISQSIKRLFGYCTALIGLWSIPVTQKSQALHDKLAGTIVIKT